MPGMKHGLILMAPTIADQLAAARLAESRGFDSVWATEFFNQHGFVRLAAVAQATTRVKLGTAIAYAFMRTPLLASAAAMDIDELSGGRMILGLGSGTRSMNERWYSVPFKDPPAPRMREAVSLVRAAIAAQKGGGLRFDGAYYKIDIPQYARPYAPRSEIPIYIAAVNRGMIRAAAAVADGWSGTDLHAQVHLREGPAGPGLEVRWRRTSSVRSATTSSARREAARRSPSTTRRACITACSKCTAGATSERPSRRPSSAATSRP
jgi:alkanesulfonate monooxygenase SsuD/methylene tetrahydromethanopterin reductase-like flavin-dependent oxidoreductase (luciferase family)